MVPVSAGGMMLANANVRVGVARLPAPVANTLAALAGPAERLPLVYTGDTVSSLSALRQDLVTSYHAVCGALGEPERIDLLAGNLPAAAALGVNLPLPPPASSAIARLPPLLQSSSAAPLLLLPGESAASPLAPIRGHSQGGSVAMALGPSIGIEGVGSGSDMPSGGALRAGGPLLGGLRSLSAGSAGLNPYGRAGGGAAALGLVLGRGAQNWPMGRPGGSQMAGAAAGGGGLAYGAAREGPRLGLLSGFSRPQDGSSDFLGEESAIVYPPAGRNFGGGPSTAARAAGYGAGGQALIDGMDDFRFRGGGRKHIQIEDLDNPSRPVPNFRRNDNGQAERFLQEYARDASRAAPSAAAAVAAGAGTNRFRMPF